MADYPGAVFSRHALGRMAERGIRKDEVLAVLKAPSMDLPSWHAPGRRVLRGTVSGRTVSVVVGRNRFGVLSVITVWTPDEPDEEAT